MELNLSNELKPAAVRPSSLRSAPFGRRFIAYAIDLTIVSVVLAVSSAVFGLGMGFILAGMGSPLVPDLESPMMVKLGPQVTTGSLVMLAILFLVFAFLIVAIYHGYFIHFEQRDGQTWGKRWLGLRVVDGTSGGPITRQQATTRDLMRYIDVGLVIPGPLAILLDPVRARRLGDRVARTRVVWERK